jgi:hypothetical protein
MEEILMQVVEALQQGATPEEIAQTLMEQGYSEQDIQSIFMTIQQQVEGQAQEETPMMQDGGEANNADLMMQIVSLIEQGIDINEILNALVQQGYDQEQAASIIEQVMVEMENQQMAQPQQPQPPMMQEGGEIILSTGIDKANKTDYKLKLKPNISKEEAKELIDEINLLGDNGIEKQKKIALLESKLENPQQLIKALKGSGSSELSGENVSKLLPEKRFNNATFKYNETPNSGINMQTTPTSVSGDGSSANANTKTQNNNDTKEGDGNIKGTELDIEIDLGDIGKRRFRDRFNLANLLPFVAPMPRNIYQQAPYRQIQPIEVSPEERIQEAMGSFAPSISAAGNIGGGAGAATQAYLQSQYADTANKAITDAQMTNVQLQQQADNINFQADMATDRVNLGLAEDYVSRGNAIDASRFQNLDKALGILAKQKRDANSIDFLNQMGDFSFDPTTNKILVDPNNLANFINTYSGYGNQLVAQQSAESKKEAEKKRKEQEKEAEKSKEVKGV